MQQSELEEHVTGLESELAKTKDLLLKTLSIIDEHSGKDINEDGLIG